jgi:uncharacterized RDD family membrane protein YckC
MIEGRYQTFWRRLGASFIDGLIFHPLNLLNKHIWEHQIDHSVIFLLTWYLAYMLLFRLYSILLHGWFGQTLGKMACGVIILDVSEHKKLSMFQAIKRDILPVITFFIYAAIFTPLILQKNFPVLWEEAPVTHKILIYSILIWTILELITMLASKKRRALHDFIAGSVVVKKAYLTRLSEQPEQVEDL